MFSFFGCGFKYNLYVSCFVRGIDWLDLGSMWGNVWVLVNIFGWIVEFFGLYELCCMDGIVDSIILLKSFVLLVCFVVLLIWMEIKVLDVIVLVIFGGFEIVGVFDFEWL